MGSSTKIGSLVVEVDGNIGGLQNQIKAARGVVHGLADDVKAKSEAAKNSFETVLNPIKNLSNMLGPLALGFGAILSINAFGNLINSTADAAGKMEDLSMQTGISVENLSALEEVGKFSDVSLDKIASTANKMSKNLLSATEEGKGAAAALRTLNIDLDDFRKLSPDQQMLSVAKAMDNFADGGGKSATAMALMGKEGAAMIPFMKDLAETGELNARVTTEQAATAGRYGDNLTKIQTASEEWKRHLALSMLPVMEEVTGAWLAATGGNDGLTASIKKLAADGTFEQWARNAVIGVSYLIDVGHGLFSLLPLIGTAIAGMAAASSAAFGAIYEAFLKIKAGDLSGAWDSIKTGANEVGTIAKDVGQDISGIWNQELLGEKIRKGMDQVREARKEAAKPIVTKPQLDTAEFVSTKSIKEKTSAYETLINTINEKMALQAAEMQGEKELTEVEKYSLKIMTDIQQGTLKLTEAEKLNLGTMLEKLSVDEKSNITRKEMLKLGADLVKQGEDEVKSLDSQIKAAAKHNQEIGLTKEQVDQLNVSRLRSAVAADEELAANVRLGAAVAGDLKDAYLVYADALELAAGKKRKLADINENSSKKQFNVEEIEKATKSLDAFLDPTKAQTFGEALKGAFGGAGDALGRLTSTLQAYGIKEAEIARARKEAIIEANGNAYVLAERNQQIAERELQYKLGSYGDMAGAAAEFFDKESKGYEVLSGISKAFHAAEIALQLASIAPKLAAGAASMFGQSGWGGFAGVAAMGVVMAGFGISSKASGSAGQSYQEMQKTQGTGSVFGDAEAKSESISKSIDDLNKNSNRLLPVNQSMLAALKSIESSMTGFTNLLARDQGVANGGNFGVTDGRVGGFGKPTDAISKIGSAGVNMLLPGVLGSVANFMTNLWGKTTQKMTDSGVSFGGKLSDLQAGQGFSQYANVDTTTSSWFGLKKSTTSNQLNQSLSHELSSQMGLIFSGMSDALKEANKLLGGDAKEIEATFANLVLSTEKISLKGLSGDELNQALNGVISKSLDEMAEAVFPAYDKFRAFGEGYAQTVLRVANTFASANQIFEEINLKLFEVGDAGVSASVSFVELIGGLDKLQSASQSYLENYFTEEERRAKTLEALTSEFEKQALPIQTSREGYRALVEEISRTGTAEQLATLFKLNDAFASVYEAIDGTAELAKQKADADKLEADILSQRLSLQEEYNQLTMTSAQLMEVQRAAIYAANETLYESIQVVKAKQAADAESLAMQNAIAQERAGLQAELDNLILTEEEKLKRKRDALYKDNQSIFDQIRAEEAKQAMIEQSKIDAQKMLAAEKDAFDAQYQAAKAIQDVWQSAANSIVDEVNRIRGTIDESQGNSFASAQSRFAITTAQARAGDVEAAKLLPALSKTIFDLSKNEASSSLELSLMRARLAQSLEDTLSISQANRGGGLNLSGLTATPNYVPQNMVVQPIFNPTIVSSPSYANTSTNASVNNDELIRVLKLEIGELKTVVSSLLTATGDGNRDRAVIKTVLKDVTTGTGKVNVKGVTTP